MGVHTMSTGFYTLATTSGLVFNLNALLQYKNVSSSKLGILKNVEKHICSWHDKVIVIRTLNREV